MQVPAPLEGPPVTRRVGLFRGGAGYEAEPGVARALDEAARALENAGYEVEEAVPPHGEEAAVLWPQALPLGADTESQESVEAVLRAQSPMLATAMLGLPGLSVPTGIVGGVPTGVQLVSARFREDLCLQAGEAIEQASGRLVPP